MLNVICLNGRLVSDPELAETPNGVAVCKINVAVERNQAGADGKRVTDFFTCIIWRGLGEMVAKYFKKGSWIAIQGELQTRSYEDKNKNKRTAFEIIANSVSFCGGKADDEPKQEQAPKQENKQAPKKEPKLEQAEIDDDDLPF